MNNSYSAQSNIVHENSPVQRLEPVLCSSCGSAVPLADSKVVDCVYCGAKVDIPEKYHRNTEAKKRLQLIRKHAQSFLEKLGRKPSTVEIFISKFPSWVFLLLFLFFGIGFINSLISAAASVASKVAGVIIYDILPAYVSFVFYTGGFFLAVVFTMGGFFYIRQRVFVSRRLMSALAANPPAIPGGHATCRRCGAPFNAPANDLVAACDYCATENFLQVPTEWLSKTQKLSVSADRNVFWAEREYEREKNSALKSFYSQTIIYFSLAVIIMLMFYSMSASGSSRSETWKESVSSSERLLKPIPSDNPVPDFGKPFKPHNKYTRYRDAKGFDYRFAMKKGEKITFTLLQDNDVRVHIWSQTERQILRLKEKVPQTFEAAIGGWYTFKIVVPNEIKEAELLIDFEE